MIKQLNWNTVTPVLKSGLLQLMGSPLFNGFRLVGGTALSLQLAHRLSIDIDLSIDAPYDSIDFKAIDIQLRALFGYVSPVVLPMPIGMGVSYIIGANSDNAFKLDIYYTDPYIRPMLEIEHIRMAAIEDIIAMKIDVIQRGGRKKDFWDIHELMDKYSIAHMIRLHKEKYSHTHDEALIRGNFVNFSSADNDFDPICLKGKQWEIIKLDIIEAFN